MPTSTPTIAEAGPLDLARAIVASSPVPLLLLDGDLIIVAASASFCRSLFSRHASAPGQPLSSLGEGEWAPPKIRSLLTATALWRGRYQGLRIRTRPGGQAHPLPGAQRPARGLPRPGAHPRSAGRDRRHRGARQRAAQGRGSAPRTWCCLQEVRHRVANSLQIIASVLLQNARKTPSEETRGHLHDAHHRVMSVAALERQLSGSGEQRRRAAGLFHHALRKHLGLDDPATRTHLRCRSTGSRRRSRPPGSRSAWA